MELGFDRLARPLPIRPFRERLAERVTPALAAGVLRRDDGTCRYCGFRSARHQEVISVSGVRHDFDALATVCLFCLDCIRLDIAARAMSGALIWLPQVEQARLNRLVRFILLVQSPSNDDRAKRAKALMTQLEARRAVAREKIGTDLPWELAELEKDEMLARVDEFRHGLRLLANGRRVAREGRLEFNRFPLIIAFWHREYRERRDDNGLLDDALAEAEATLAGPMA